MGFRALSTVSLGLAPSAHAGDQIPATFLDQDGNPQTVDFERLVELGVAEELKAPAKKPAAKE